MRKLFWIFLLLISIPASAFHWVENADESKTLHSDLSCEQSKIYSSSTFGQIMRISGVHMRQWNRIEFGEAKCKNVDGKCQCDCERGTTPIGFPPKEDSKAFMLNCVQLKTTR